MPAISTACASSSSPWLDAIFAFSDAGNVWRDGETVDLGTLRASAGLGLSWVSPVGPLQLSYAVPVKVERYDKIQRFQFQIGTSF